MSAPWQEDIEIPPSLAGLLIDNQFPTLRPVKVTLLGIGWDNAAYLINNQFVFRFPRRQFAVGTLDREIRFLPLLAPHLPLRIPVPAFVGRPNSAYPYVFAGYPFLEGDTACQFDWTFREREAIAASLAQFLRTLHSLEKTAEIRQEAPKDDLDRANLMKRLENVKARLEGVSKQLRYLDAQTIVTVLDRAARAEPWREETVWVHGDLYARHLLVDDSRSLTGVIDWGDMHLGDPALDLSIAFSFLPLSARATFWNAYGRIDSDTLERARFRALFYGVVLTEYGLGIGDTQIQRVGEFALANAVA